MKQSELDFINHLRQSSPYVAQHAGKTIVIYLSGTLIANQEKLLELAKDIILLRNLNIKVVLTLGATPQIDHAFSALDIKWESYQTQRITSETMLPALQKTIGSVRSQLEATFIQASAEQHTPVAVVSGNWVISQPKGVINGIDFQHTGKLRKINQQAIQATLDANQIALLTPLTYSFTGEVFNLNSLELATSVSQQLNADKLMIFTEAATLQELPKSMSQPQACQLQPSNPKTANLLQQVTTKANKVKRIHIMNQDVPGALLLEVLSRDGLGSLIFNDRYHQIHKADHEDIAGILNLISPLEKEGILVKRSREALELEIENFWVLEIDQLVIGCAALYPIDEQTAELACLAIHQDYQGQQLGRELLQQIKETAKEANFTKLCLLTTHTDHWFIEQGFLPAAIEDLPQTRQSLYNLQRKSKVLIQKIQ